jgi:hypothetical protein
MLLQLNESKSEHFEMGTKENQSRFLKLIHYFWKIHLEKTGNQYILLESERFVENTYLSI